MGWERRGHKSYCYRKERCGDRVRTIYVGRADIGVLVAESDTILRQRNEAQRAKERLEEERASDALDQGIESLTRLSSTLVDAVLIAAGFHQHKRQWRMRRG